MDVHVSREHRQVFAQAWRSARVGIAIAGWTCGAAACGGSSSTLCKPDPITGSQLCALASRGYGTAAAVTAVAASVYYAGAGCTWNGCELPDRCNPQTKRCETIRCGESSACPSGYNCDLSDMLCR
jgi:hypothetical protein